MKQNISCLLLNVFLVQGAPALESPGGYNMKATVVNDLFLDAVNGTTLFLSPLGETGPIFCRYFFQDTVIVPAETNPGATDVKVSISNGQESIEFTPLSSQTNGTVIAPVNPNTNRGISTTFLLPDSSDWKFYTNDRERLKINGAGNIITSAPLLVNGAAPDSNAVLRVNGVARFDSIIRLQGATDTGMLISMDLRAKHAGTDFYDGQSPYTTTPIHWANGGNIPVFRIRHPNKNDFMILPYQYGTAIEYNGVVECWVGEWSIHRGLLYYDVEGKNNGWGAVMWVGDDEDTGGLRATARDNKSSGGNVQYGELSVEKFSGTPHGDLRLRLPSTNNSFQFVYGERGSNNVVAKVSDKGFFIPAVATVSAIVHPEKAQLVFDSTDNQLKAFSGSRWVSLSENSGTVSFSANGSSTEYVIPHSLGKIPGSFNVQAASSDAANISYVTADASHLVIHYNYPPRADANNLHYSWIAKP